MTDETISVSGLSKRYGPQFALREVNASFAEGECVALVGHNGAGKTTLIKLLLGLTRPSAGSIRVFGVDPSGPGAAGMRRAVGYLPENVVLHSAMPGRELLRFYARLKRRPLAEVEALLERVGLSEAARRRVGTYSKGMRQRLGLAQALLGEPRLLFLDEPTSGLDPALRQTVYEIIAERRAGGATVLLSSHALAELESRADRVVILDRGVVAASGSIGELRRLAALPVRLRVRLANGTLAALPAAVAPVARCAEPDGQVVELTCAPADKLEVLRRLGRLDHVEDIEILPATLDQLYARFLQERARA